MGPLRHSLMDRKTQPRTSSVRFYFKRGRWHVTSDKQAVPARVWWDAINQVKCMNHKLRTAQ